MSDGLCRNLRASPVTRRRLLWANLLTFVKVPRLKLVNQEEPLAQRSCASRKQALIDTVKERLRKRPREQPAHAGGLPLCHRLRQQVNRSGGSAASVLKVSALNRPRGETGARDAHPLTLSGLKCLQQRNTTVSAGSAPASPSYQQWNPGGAAHTTSSHLNLIQGQQIIWLRGVMTCHRVSHCCCLREGLQGRRGLGWGGVVGGGCAP